MLYAKVLLNDVTYTVSVLLTDDNLIKSKITSATK